MNPVEVRRLTKTFHDESRGAVRAVDGIDFECHAGEIFGLLGANGAGKTTTLRMLSTLLKPTSGVVSIAGHDVVEDAENARKSLGFCSTGTALYPRLTARETLEFFARINGYPESRIRARVDDLIGRFGLASYAGARVEKLSSGMKQKVSLARTVAHDPAVVIFDEPTANLDVLNAIEVRETMKSLRAEGKALVFSTHLMNEAEHLCDRIAIVHRGRILACDTLDGLRRATGKHYLEEVFLSYVQAPE